MESWRCELRRNQRLELYHHGIKGQRWGVRNGPPYPLGAGDHSASERKAGWRKSLNSGGKVDKSTTKRYSGSAARPKRQGLSEGQKRALKTGAVIAVAALATYGAYKTGSLDRFTSSGERYVRRALGRTGTSRVGDFSNFTPPPAPKSQPQTAPKSKPRPVIRDPVTNFKKITKLNEKGEWVVEKETISDSLKNANPLRGTSDGGNNCTYCSIAGFLRTLGYDVTAKSTGGKMQNLAGVLEDCFKGVKVREGSAVKFAKSPEDAAEMLKKRFGDNASGAVGIDFINSGGRGHAFSWSIKNGVVQFLDFQQGTSDESVRQYWKFIDPNGNLTFARLDGLEINLDNVDKYVNGR